MSTRARREREARFEDLVQEATPKLRRVAFLLTGSWQDAEDMTQSALLKAFRHLDRIVSVAAPHAYLRQILVRTCIDESRRMRSTEIPSDTIPDTPTHERDDELKWEVRAALRKVPQSQREVLILRFYADLSVADTAALLKCSEGNVKSQTSRGLDALSSHLSAGTEPTS